MTQRHGRAGRGIPPVAGHRRPVSRWGRSCLVAVAAVLLAVLPGWAPGPDLGPGTSPPGAEQQISGDHVAVMILRGPRSLPGRGWLDRARPDPHPVGHAGWHQPAVLIDGPPRPAPIAAVGSVVAWHAPGIGTKAARSGRCRAPPRPSVDSTF